MQPDWNIDIVISHAAVHSITSSRERLATTVDLSNVDSARALMAPE